MAGKGQNINVGGFKPSSEKSSKPNKNRDELHKKVNLLLASLWNLSEDVWGNIDEVVKETEKLGSLLNSCNPEKLLQLYRKVENDLRKLDDKLRSDRYTSMLGVVAATMAHARTLPSHPSDEVKFGTIFLILPFVSTILNSKEKVDDPLDPLGLKKTTLAFYIGACTEGSPHFEALAYKLLLQARCNDFSDQSLLYLFTFMKKN